MSEVGEALGTAVEGGLIARAVEPAAGEAGGGHTGEAACLNCGTPLAGPHCHQCGQRGHQHRTLAAFFHDLLHGVLHFEGKIWRTLPLLLWRPGQLTREYIDGRRATYVSPIALFLFVVFLTFAAINFAGGSIDLDDKVNVGGEQVSTRTAEQRLNAQIRQAQDRRGAMVQEGVPTTGIDSEIAGLRRALQTVEAVKNDDLGALAQSVGPGNSLTTKSTGNNFDALWQRAKANPELLIYKLQSNAYKFSWLLIPISVPFLWLLFPFSRRFHLYDHTVFVTYSLSFMMLALAVATAGAMYDFAPLLVVPILYAPLHIYWQVRGTYGTSRLGGIARTALLLVFACVALVLWAFAMIGLLLGD